MSTVRLAPWHIKVLLLVLPLLLCLRLFALGVALRAIAASTAPVGKFVTSVLLDLMIVFYLAAATGSTWRRKPFARWLIAGVFVLVIVNNIYQDFHPGPGPVQVPRFQVDEERPTYQLGVFLTQAVLLWWAYMCVFSSGALAFFGIPSVTKALPREFGNRGK